MAPSCVTGIRRASCVALLLVALGAGAGDGAAGLARLHDAAPPSAPDLTAASDSGASSSDNLTNAATLVFTGTATGSTTVTLYRDAAAVGTASADASSGAWSIADGSAADGVYTYTATATDGAGSTSAPSAGLSVTVDRAPPEPPRGLDLAAADDSADFRDNVTNATTLHFSGTAKRGATVTLYRAAGWWWVTGGVGTPQPVGTATASAADATWSVVDSGVSDGLYTYSAAATDGAGNTSAVSEGLNVRVDTVTSTPTIRLSLPNPPLPGPPLDQPCAGTDDAGTTNSRTVTLCGLAEVDADMRVNRSSVWGTEWVGGGTIVADCCGFVGNARWWWTDTVPVDGVYTYTVTATDRAGNAAATSGPLVVTVDTVAPSLNVSGAANGSAYTLPDLPQRPSFAPADAGSGIASKSDSWQTPSGGGAGTYTYLASATDRAGNTASETRTYTVSTATTGGGGGGGAPPDLRVEVGADQAIAPAAGGQIVWRLTVTDQPSAQTAFGVFADVTLPDGFTVAETYSDRGPGCVAGAPGLVCNLDFVGPGTVGHVMIAGTVGRSGPQTLAVRLRHAAEDANAADDTASLTLQPAATPAPSPPPATVSRPATPRIGAATISPKAAAGKRVTVSFRVTRSDTGKPLAQGSMTSVVSVGGTRLPHSDRFGGGVAQVRFRIPGDAKGRLLTVTVGIRADGRAASRRAVFRIG